MIEKIKEVKFTTDLGTYITFKLDKEIYQCKDEVCSMNLFSMEIAEYTDATFVVKIPFNLIQRKDISKMIKALQEIEAHLPDKE